MKVTILAVGESKNKNTLSLEGEYLKRLTPYIKTSIIEVPTRKLSSLSEKERKIKEAEILMSKVSKEDYLVLLDENGANYSTSKFASIIKKHMLESTKHIVFAVGGVYGWDDGIKKKANMLMSLSPLTFTYEFARVILVEQIYRAATIIKGIPYHKE